MPDDGPTVEDLMRPLPRAGGSLGAAAAAGVTGARSWVVAGATGGDLIRAAGATRVGAWRRAVAPARVLGRPGRPAGS